VKLSRLLVGAGKEHSKHVQLDSNYHQVRSPAVHVAEQLAEGYVMLQVEHISKCLHLARMVVEHQQNAGEGQHDEQVEGDTSHSPGVAVTHRVAVDLSRMKVEEDVRQDSQGAVARRIIVFVTED